MSNYTIFITIFVLEIYTLIAILMALGLRRLWTYFHDKKSAWEIKTISSLFIKFLEQKEPLELEQYKKLFRAHKSLLKVMESFNLRFQGDPWEGIRDQIANVFLLPKAKILAKSFFFRERHWAARSFAACPLAEDEPLILSLIDDSEFLVRSRAGAAAVKLESVEGIRLILEHMKMDPGYSYFFFRDILISGSKEVFSKVIELAKEPSLHLVCLDILSSKSVTLPIPFLDEDLKKEDPKTRLFALRVLTRNPNSKTASILQNALQDPDWKIRKVAAFGLINYPIEPSFKNLASHLNDPSWQVRVEAAKALKKMGPKGLELLQHQRADMDQTSYETAQYALQFG